MKPLRRLQEAVSRVFPGLELEGLGQPTKQGTFVFKKGKSRGWPVNNLSAGEKSAFELLLDLVLTGSQHPDMICCIDEPELHVHSAVQGPLLREMLALAPDAWQFWIATHAIGIVREAWEIERRSPGTVVFIDMDGHDFDESVTLSPVQPSRNLFDRVYRVAIGDLADLVVPEEVILCEGSNGCDGFDAKVLELIFGQSHPDSAFVSAGGATEVGKAGGVLMPVMRRLAGKVTVRTLRDRDDLSDEEVVQIRLEGNRVLGRREIENYLWDEEILRKLAEHHVQAEKAEELVAARENAIATLVSRNLPADDVKSAAREIKQACRRILGLTQSGGTNDAFALGQLVPLITPETETYRELERDVFGLAVEPTLPKTQ